MDGCTVYMIKSLAGSGVGCCLCGPQRHALFRQYDGEPLFVSTVGPTIRTLRLLMNQAFLGSRVIQDNLGTV